MKDLYNVVEEEKLRNVKGMILDRRMKILGDKNRERLVMVANMVYDKLLDHSYEAFEESDLASEDLSETEIGDVMPFFRQAGLVSRSGIDGAYSLKGV